MKIRVFLIYYIPITIGLLQAAAVSAQTRLTCLRVAEKFGPPGALSLKAKKWVTGLSVPWSIAFLPNPSPGRSRDSFLDALVTERPGRVRLIRQGKLVTSPLLSVQVAEAGEGGLLGIALHPSFAANRLFYLYATLQNGGKTINQVSRYRLAEDLMSATFDRVILDDVPGSVVHDGGRLRFGPDGMLYIGTGDARTPKNSQDLSTPAGKLLRLTPDGEIPKDNPTPGNSAFLSGIRNTQGFDWIDDKRLALVDHGPSGDLGRTGGDELNVATTGANLGWPSSWKCEAQNGHLAPVLTWDDANPPGGVLVYRGKAIPELNQNVLMTSLGGRHLHRVVLTPGASPTVKKHETYFKGDAPQGFGRLRDIVQGPDGAIYVTTSNCDGRGTCPDDRDAILRITK